MNTPGEPFDMAFFVTPSVDFYDPYAFLNIYFESRFIGRTNSSNLRSPESRPPPARGLAPARSEAAARRTDGSTPTSCATSRRWSR